eukprot:7167453-Pyramimonas_sp.AAC.1
MYARRFVYDPVHVLGHEVNVANGWEFALLDARGLRVHPDVAAAGSTPNKHVLFVNGIHVTYGGTPTRHFAQQ